MNYLNKALKSIEEEEEKRRTDKEYLLSIPIRELRKPLAVYSQILDEVIYLVANEEMARQVEAEGKVAYIPEEITALDRASKTRSQEEWIDFLKKMHLVKKMFMGSRIQA
jgi:hypothetical protein